MKCPPEYWIWLQRAVGPGKSINNLLSFFGDPVSLYEAGHNAWIESKSIKQKDIDRLIKYSPSQSYDIMKLCVDNGWHIVTCDDDNYPPLLKETDDYPALLYVWGDVDVLTAKVAIGIVGTRNASEYGIRVAESLSKSIALSGAVIVSGGALGIDKAAHRGAVSAGGKTIAVLGCGLGYPYLLENEKMRAIISENGAVISEYPPFTPPSKMTFPVRNRIISGISLGTVVIEAGIRSGSLITARLALEQGRDVYAVPGDVMSAGNYGTNSLIRDGAKPVFSALDVLDSYKKQYGEYLNLSDDYEPLYPLLGKRPLDKNEREYKKSHVADNGEFPEHYNRKKNGRNNKNVKLTESNEEKEIIKKKNDNQKENSNNRDNPEIKNNERAKNNNFQKNKSENRTAALSVITENARTVFSALGTEPKLIDEIVMTTGLQAQDVAAALTELEMYSLAAMQSGKRYYLLADE